MDVVWENRDAVLIGFTHTILLFVLAGIGSLVVGTIIAAMRAGPIPVLRYAAIVYVSLVRNTPLLMILILFRFALPKVGITFNLVDIVIPTSAGDIRLNNIFTACLFGLIVYTASFVAEAIRAGINAVPLGQAEAARAIGLPFGGVMREVVLPQAFRATVPPLASVQIALIKNTTVAGAVGVVEAFNVMRSLTNDYASARIQIFLVFALIFVVLVEVYSFAAHRLERRWKTA
ncbi:amino acid ABC transporter permease [Nocardioides sp. GY 10113]|uniref:amino acid ABC transporter permease n=1 Tax=Nocardioides sp. GY 10113 TaxID=2569761 RepID=UPI0010A8999F|nr:amino acid ABC transporter permease [Nocardioides sp. GY 10113]TIC85949.1 amino acid ABC transporter permease [Nocardioides sp. GY 10113]